MKKLILFALVVSCGIITTLTNPSLADVDVYEGVVVFKEFSSTQLTASTGSVTNLGPDLWSWSPPPLPLPIGPKFIGSNTWYWVEPENANLGNQISLGSGLAFRISSDIDVTGHTPPWTAYANGAIQSPELFVEDANGVTHVWDAQFFDYGDVAAPTPEPATMLLLGSGLIALAGYGRKKFFEK